MNHRSRLSLLCCLFLFALAGAVLAGTPTDKPFRILLVDDDGVEAEGIIAMKKALEGIGEVIVVAPQENKSGAGHSLTVQGPIQERKAYVDGKFFGNGLDATPASCVKVALAYYAQDVDLVVSGINKGFNIGQVIYVSGTFGAAQEAVCHGIPGIAVSLERGKHMDFAMAADFVVDFIQKLRTKKLRRDIVYNINVPACTREELQGVAVTTLSDFQWREMWTRRKNPFGSNYFWGTIRRPLGTPPEGTDYWAIQNKMISVTPVPLISIPTKELTDLRRLHLEFQGKTMH